MSKQFDQYAELYDELFSATNDYKKEVNFYDKILKKYDCNKILEVGCGCGNRGKYFIRKHYQYVGSDISNSMLKIARRKYPTLRFIQSDARKLKIKGSFDAILFLGKGSTYLTTDSDVVSTLKSMKRIMKKGIIIIDGFNAGFIIPNFKTKISWSKRIGKKTIKRKSVNILNQKNLYSWERMLTYIVEDNHKISKYYDKAILRAFTAEEWRSLYAKAGIKKVDIMVTGDTIISVGIII